MANHQDLIRQFEALTDENAHIDALMSVAHFYRTIDGMNFQRPHFRQTEQQLAQLRTTHVDIGYMTDAMYREREDIRRDLRRLIADVDAAAPILAHI